MYSSIYRDVIECAGTMKLCKLLISPDAGEYYGIAETADTQYEPTSRCQANSNKRNKTNAEK